MFKRTTYFSTLLVAILFIGGLSQANAQIQQERIGYVNPTAILQKMPEMKAVQQKLQNFVDQKKKQLATQSQNFQDSVSNYQSRQSVISKAAQQKEEQQLGKMQADLQQAQQQAQQSIQQKQQDLVSPLYEEINKSIQNVAKQKNLSYVINTQTNSGDLIILYASDEAQQKYDITDEVMSDLGIGQ